MRRFSLRRRLVMLLLGSLTLVWVGMLAWNYFDAREEINELSDVRLEQTVRTLMQLDLKRLGGLADTQSERYLPPEAPGAQGLGVMFQVWSSAGQLLLASQGAPGAAFDPHDGHAQLSIQGLEWRSYAAHDPRRGYQVRVFESSQARDALVNKLAWRTAQALLLALPVLALLMWFGIGRGLRPLHVLSREIGSRDARRLEPIDIARVPREAQPLVDSLNQLLQRLAHSLDRERAFTADAAHELRTPLAAIKVQAQVAQAARSDTERRHATEQIVVAVNRTTRLVQQLLLLARLDHAGSAERRPVDLGALARESAARFAEDALRKEIDLQVTAESGGILEGNVESLSVMIDNLLDNAIKYARRHGRIALNVARDASEVELSVVDDGPGVPAEQRDRLMERFFRVAGSAAPGSGLGLPIVAKIVQAHGGRIQTGTGLGGRGLRVSVRFAAVEL